MTRVFIALELNEALQSHLTTVIRRVAQVLPDVHWVAPAGIHLTLAFLGELSDERLQEAIQATESAAQQCAPFAYQLARLGIFGTPGRPRVIWMGIEEPSGALSTLHSVLNRELAQRQFEPDTRPFSPHLTLARVKAPLTSDEQKSLQGLLAGPQVQLATSQRFLVQQLDVMKSELKPAGAHYTRLLACSLMQG